MFLRAFDPYQLKVNKSITQEVNEPTSLIISACIIQCTSMPNRFNRPFLKSEFVAGKSLCSDDLIGEPKQFRKMYAF